MIKQALKTQFTGSQPRPCDSYWFDGQPCIAKYYLDEGWYRAKVLQVRRGRVLCQGPPGTPGGESTAPRSCRWAGWRGYFQRTALTGRAGLVQPQRSSNRPRSACRNLSYIDIPLRVACEWFRRAFE